MIVSLYSTMTISTRSMLCGFQRQTLRLSARDPASRWTSSRICTSTIRPPLAWNTLRYLSSSPPVDRLGLGGYKWSKMDASTYQQVIRTALENGISTIEAGQEGEDVLLEALTKSKADNPNLALPTILWRVGYRTVEPPTSEAAKSIVYPHDVQIDELPPVDRQQVVVGEAAAHVRVFHNIGTEAIQAAISQSKLTTSPSVAVTVLLHNPEEQVHNLADKSAEERQFRIRQRLAEAFVALQEHVDNGNIASFGVVSNGICLPSSHPLHLAYQTLVDAATDATEKAGKPLDLAVLQLPLNVIETTGLEILAKLENDRDVLAYLKVYAMRPLACYPDRGTGTGKPIVLHDHLLPATMEKTFQWSNEMQEPPAVYEVALKTAMAHFDAEELIQAKLDGQNLTTDQRETLDGCKLLQSLLHDVDNGLEKVRSYAAHEEDLYNKIIPLIHDTFEGYDEATAKVLQSFFGAYSLAVRYAIAKNTRKLLKEGESGSNIPVFSDLPQEMRLQEFGLRFLLKEGAIAKIIVGATSPEQVVDDVEIVSRVLEEQPMQAVSAAGDEGKVGRK